jgi:Icc-related predicted phosphoesterase
VKIVFISDVHCKQEELVIPPCDLLVSCGDFSMLGKQNEVRAFHTWMNRQPAKHLISVMGNHEINVEANFGLSKEIALEVCPRVHFIEEGLIEIEGVKIWCSAHTPEFCDWAYNVPRGYEIKRHWDMIPDNIDILVTHGPPFGVLDTVRGGPHLGCEELIKAVERVKPLIHAFGHIHDSFGKIEIDGATYINASICDERYSAVNPVRVEEI